MYCNPQKLCHDMHCTYNLQHLQHSMVLGGKQGYQSQSYSICSGSVC